MATDTDMDAELPVPYNDDPPTPFDGREWLFFALAAGVLVPVAAASGWLFLRADGLEALFHTPAPSPSAYDLTVRDQLAHLWADTVFLVTVGTYLLWGTLTAGVSMLAGYAVLALVYLVALERPIRFLDQFGIETRAGRPTLADGAVIALLGTTVGTGFWYTQPLGLLEATARGIGAVGTIFVLAGLGLAVDTGLERAGDWVRANSQSTAPRERDE